MNAAQVLAEHAAALPTFQKQFPVGGVSSAAAVVEEKKQPFKMDSNFAARINAVRGK